jgi:hypothetical protein
MATSVEIEMIRANFASQKDFILGAGDAVPQMVQGLVKLIEDLLEEVAEQGAEIERLKAERN